MEKVQFKMRFEQYKTEVKRLQDLEKLLYTTFHSIELTGELKTEDLMLFIKSVQGIDQREKFWKRYFNEEEQQIIQGLPTFEENDKKNERVVASIKRNS